MPDQFVNPSPNLPLSHFIAFDFPCEEIGEGVIQAGSYSAVNTFGNVNLKAPGIEQLYGTLGNPPREQGHPFMKQYAGALGGKDLEAKDPGLPTFHDQVLDIDRGIQIDHTGRLSGSFVEFLASKPFFSVVKVSAVPHAPVVASSQSIPLATFTRWLEPAANGPNVWFWRAGSSSQELLFTLHIRIDDLSQIPGGASFQPEAVYKLVVQWKFWKYTGQPPYPGTPPDDPQFRTRLPLSGFDEAMSFEVISATKNM